MLKHVREEKSNRPYSSIFIDQQLIDDGWMPTRIGFLCPSKFACFVACQFAAAYQPQLNAICKTPQKTVEFSQCTFPEKKGANWRKTSTPATSNWFTSSTWKRSEMCIIRWGIRELWRNSEWIVPIAWEIYEKWIRYDFGANNFNTSPDLIAKGQI